LGKECRRKDARDKIATAATRVEPCISRAEEVLYELAGGAKRNVADQP
jgi:hypothetical protein